MYPKQVFQVWMIVLSIVWVVLNRPHLKGSLKTVWISAGWPFPFAMWVRGELVLFDLQALAINASLGVLGIFALSQLCVWSRCRE
ncbi:hypothetical protein [Tuwongella immobilis]|uniref:Uncharacterized protein n=1 Tax=Tuwongella immobilis TaxID=692036 RepID=A0A6C2YT27_9BACT|nr:hypothetical protein [Tuwongella immobilis]VIP04075.1 unnamed protein product [Tuwongella immobilis]VTS05517.1 unnamed protein product [Tuwongella immobilis]